jgi:D-alanyl-D-alanine carboxypeptidase
MRMLRLTIGLCLAGALTFATAAAATTPVLHADAIDAIVTAQMALQRVPGVSITIERGGRIVYAKGYGYRDTASAIAVDPATYFEIGSITKQFTAAAIAKLVLDGKLHFSDTVATYLPDAPHAAEITIAQLLNHTSGVHDYLGTYGVQPFLYSTTARPADLYGLVSTLPLDFPPGTRFAYSNTNYIILGAIIERVSGMTYDAFLRTRLFAGTPFAGISYGAPAGKIVSDGYEGGDQKKPLTIWSPNVSYAAGSLYATPTELARWDDAFFHGRVVAPAMVAQLTTPPKLPDGKPTSYADGWIASQLDGHRMIAHSGGIPGFSTSNSYFPDQDLAIVVFGNAINSGEGAITRGILRTFVAPTAAAVAAENTPAAGEDAAITARMRAEWNAVCSGTLDRSRYAPATSAALTDAMVQRVGADLVRLGTPSAFVFVSKRIIGGSTVYVYRVITPARSDLMQLSINGDDKIDGIFFRAE